MHTNGRCYLEEFLDDLTDKERVRVDWYFALLEDKTIEYRRNYFAGKGNSNKL